MSTSRRQSLRFVLLRSFICSFVRSFFPLFVLSFALLVHWLGVNVDIDVDVALGADVDVDVDMEVELIKPIAIEEELRFAIREGGRTVGAGTITKLVD